MLITDKKLYDKLKFFTQVVLPAFGALYFGLAGIWGLPSAEQVVGSIVVIDTFLGVVLQISSQSYARNPDGEVKVETVDGKKTFMLELNGDPEELDKKDEVRFKVTS